MLSSNINRFVPYALITALLMWALVPMNPYGYYSVMRWAVCASLIYLAIKANEQHQPLWIWIWGVAAGVYNPILPVHATRGFWSLINVITIALVIFGAIAKYKELRKQD